MFDCKHLCKGEDGELYLKMSGERYKVSSIHIYKTTPGRSGLSVVSVPEMFGNVLAILYKMARFHNINTDKMLLHSAENLKVLHVPLHVPCWNNVELRNGEVIRDRIVKIEFFAEA